LEIDPASIDINIHPRKLEAKIDRINELFPILVNTIKKALDSSIHDDLNRKLSEFNSENQFRNPIKSTNTSPAYNQSGHFNSSNQNVIPLKKDFGNYPNKARNIIEQSLIFSENILESIPQSSAYENLFQILNTYIVVPKEDCVEIIDQHAADERINFERIQKKVKEGEMVEQKDLLIPIILDLDAIKYSKLVEKIDLLASFGFDTDPIGINKIRINSVPIFARDIKYTDFIDEIINDIEENSESKIIESITASVACHTSIRAGRKLTQEEMTKLIQDLHQCETPFSCPHGRPIIWTLSKNEIEKKFERKK
jgi:DNA mismatch repair protein MutL